MKFTTIFEAMEDAHMIAGWCVSLEESQKRWRQHNAFRARILRMDECQRMDLAEARMQLEVTKQTYKFYLDEKDARIAELEKDLDVFSSMVKDIYCEYCGSGIKP